MSFSFGGRENTAKLLQTDSKPGPKIRAWQIMLAEFLE